MNNQRYIVPAIFVLLAAAIFSSCSMQNKIARSAKSDVLATTALANAHVGISIYEPTTAKYWFNHQGDKYFVPASNTKIPTCYAAMKYLGDSLVGLLLNEYENAIELLPAADPTLLHPDYATQPVISFLQTVNKRLYGNAKTWRDNAYGKGWSWGDYNEYYMAERSALPIYGNMVTLSGNINNLQKIPARPIEQTIWKNASAKGFVSDVTRDFKSNQFTVELNAKENKALSVPFITSGDLAFKLLGDTLHQDMYISTNDTSSLGKKLRSYTLHSQPTDSVLMPMMHRSDNFFAEQSLLMVSQRLLGYINTERIIDTLLKTDFKDLPQKPRWADGSGLSRYNLFTPQDFVAIFDKMEREFGMERIKVILPTAGEGTISSYYQQDSGFIYVKTGTLSGVVALSGYLVTKKNKHLIFSILVNNHLSSATDVRKVMQTFYREFGINIKLCGISTSK